MMVIFPVRPRMQRLFSSMVAILTPLTAWAQTSQGDAPPDVEPEASLAALSPIPSSPHAALPHGLSPWGMFMAADIVVKAVMVGLFVAFVLTVVIWLAKTLELWAARARAARALRTITRATRLQDAVLALDGSRGASALLIRAAAEEVRLSEDALDRAGGDGLKERISSRMGRLVAAAGRRMGRGTGLLATIGSVGPFVGLFGTVWGIMNSFVSIAETQTTNLAVAAPGIAEALLATAIGLVAAIPAVVFYNAFARGIAGYRQILADAAAGIERLVSRDLDYRGHSAPEPTRGL